MMLIKMSQHLDLLLQLSVNLQEKPDVLTNVVTSCIKRSAHAIWNLDIFDLLKIYFVIFPMDIF